MDDFEVIRSLTKDLSKLIDMVESGNTKEVSSLQATIWPTIDDLTYKYLRRPVCDVSLAITECDLLTQSVLCAMNSFSTDYYNKCISMAKKSLEIINYVYQSHSEQELAFETQTKP